MVFKANKNLGLEDYSFHLVGGCQISVVVVDHHFLLLEAVFLLLFIGIQVVDHQFLLLEPVFLLSN